MVSEIEANNAEKVSKLSYCFRNRMSYFGVVSQCCQCLLGPHHWLQSKASHSPGEALTR